MKVTVVSKMNGGHRRAGLFIPDSQVEMDVTKEQLQAFKADGQLVCVAQDEGATTGEQHKPKAK